MSSVFFRVDATKKTGLGHAMRMLSLADECKKNGLKTFFLGDCSAEIISKIGINRHLYSLNSNLSDVNNLLISRLIQEPSSPWVVLDGYEFDEELHSKIASTGARLLVMDDYCHLPRYAADIIVNQNAGSENYHYPLFRECRLLLGTNYVLLRKEFLFWQRWVRKHEQTATKVLVTMGGSDLNGATLKVVEALEMLIDVKMNVIILTGAVSEFHDEIFYRVAKISHHKIQVLRHSQDVAGLMAWADMAISAGGTVLWELCFMSLPALVIGLASNQYAGIATLSNAGIVDYLGTLETINTRELRDSISSLSNNFENRVRMGKLGRELVDGFGAERVLNSMFNLKF